MIFTSYFANIKKLPKDVVTIAICGKSPGFYKGLQYRRLAPSWEIFSEWKQTKDNDLYTRRFKAERLAPLDVNAVVSDLKEMAGGRTMVLLCYEKPSDFCHRHLVADWLSANGYECMEFVGDSLLDDDSSKSEPEFVQGSLFD